jgi:hypothetical protein
MRFVRLASVVAALAIAAGACSSSSSTAGPGATAGAGGTGPASNPSAAMPALSLPVMPAAGGGSCSVNVTGDKTVSWEAKQDMSSLMVSYWLSAADRQMLSLDGENLILNCKGSGGSVSFMLGSGTTAADFVKGPKDYVIAAGGLLGGNVAGQISMIFGFDDKSIWKVTEPGSFKVTTLGGGKFAGTFTAKIGKSSDDLQSIVANAVLSGTFDMGCTGSACS